MPETTLNIQEDFYILAKSYRAEELIRVLKEGETFAVLDHYGDIRPVGLGEQGLYHEGTRFLSRLELHLGQDRPMILGSTVQEDNELFAADFMNYDIYAAGRVVIPRGSVHLFRSKFLWRGTCFECLRILNYGRNLVDLELSLSFAADFVDVFEVRGSQRLRRGRLGPQFLEDSLIVLSYDGLDGCTRRTRLRFSPPPERILPGQAFFRLHLQPRREETYFWTISCESGEGSPAPPSFSVARREAKAVLKEARGRNCEIVSSNEQFNAWLSRSLADLLIMITDTPWGPYPYAGVPWFSAAFGRDGLITAWQALFVNPGMARGVLSFLAALQAREVNPGQEAEPGKILHETRKGEMAALGEIPFGCYYGSVDATPLFVILAGAYYERTGDRAFIETLWPAVERALDWIDRYGDVDGDGFVEYASHASRGLTNQGWKDSRDAVFHQDGRLAAGPIALCEVQGYVYEAKRRGAQLASLLGEGGKARTWQEQAGRLQEKFERTFWCEELSFYGLALDGEKNLCRVRSSNAGHALFSGISTPSRAHAIARRLFTEDFFSGWGVRTLSASEVRYNPVSYHNGSVWPHDNSLIAQGLARYDLKDLSMKILAGLFEATIYLDLHRLPELFCGFHRRPGQGPTLYPLACAPQSWSTAAVFLLLQSCLGLSIDGASEQIRLWHPVLPDFLREVRINRLQAGRFSVDLLFRRHAEAVGVDVLRRDGPIEIVIVK